MNVFGLVMDNAQGLDYIVLDELHTYRGRQGADVAMLVRRVRDRLCSERAPICIGTSATMASQGDDAVRAAAVANAASRGASVADSKLASKMGNDSRGERRPQ